MKIIRELLDGILLLENKVFQDDRGDFRKVYNSNAFLFDGAPSRIEEVYVSISHQDVLRGMHYQLPPFSQGKLLTVLSGAIYDVAFGIDESRASYKRTIEIELKAGDALSLFVPGYFAHGFLSLAEGTSVLNCLERVYAPEFEKGLRYDCTGAQWPTKYPILSEKDNALVSF